MPIRLEWRAEQCGNTAAVEVEVARLLGGDTTANKPFSALATAKEVDSRWKVDVTTRIDGRDGERTIEVASCDEAIRGAALIIALAVDPTRVAKAAPLPVDAGAPPPPVDAAPLTPEAAPPEPASVQDTGNSDAGSASTDGVSWIVGASGLGDLGLAPGIAGGATLHTGIDAVSLRAEVAMHLLLPKEDGSATGRGGKYSSLGGTARGCWQPLANEITHAGPCAVLAIDWMSGSAEAASTPVSATTTFASLGLGGTLTAALLPALRLRLALDVLIPAARPGFFVEGPTGLVEVHRVGPVIGRASAGLELRLR